MIKGAVNRERRNTYILVGLVLIALTLFGVWWLHNHEQVTQEYRSAASWEAKQNRYLAATLLLTENGIDAETSDGLNRFQTLPSTRDAIIGENLGFRLPAQRIDELLDWAARGGHLITSSTHSWSDDENEGDRLLAELAIYPTRNNFEDVDADERPWHTLGTALLPNGDQIVAEFPPTLSLEYEWGDEYGEYFAVTSEYGTHLVSFPYGEGSITITTNLNWLYNPGGYVWQRDDEQKSDPFINGHDHAFLLWSLMHDQTGNAREKAWLIQRIQATPLPQLFWQHAPHTVITLLILVILWLWWQYNRFGPLQRDNSSERRNILEHLQMSSVYAWRQDRAEQLFAQTRSEVTALIQRQHPHIALLDEPERTIKLAELFDMPEEQLVHALQTPWRGERDFIELTSLLQQIRKKL